MVALTHAFFNYLHFYRICNMNGCLLVNKMQSQVLNPLSVLNCCLYCGRLFKNVVTSPSYINLLFKLCGQLIRKFIVLAQHDFIDLHMCDSSASIGFFNDKTEVIKRCYVNYKHDLKVIISYEFP